MIHLISLFLSLQLGFFQNPVSSSSSRTDTTQPYLIVLGIAQDGGFPHAGCEKSCCSDAWSTPSKRLHVSCIALVDPVSNQAWMFDATPDFKFQFHRLKTETGANLSGIFLTHAHIGHYTGLMHLGKEVMGSSQMPVYAMPRMKSFLQNSGPWSQLVSMQNISIQNLQQDSTIILNDRLKVTAFKVPHRDEFSETVGYRIESPKRTALFIPDIDKWSKWDRDIIKEVQQVDLAFLDGTFYKNGEIQGRNMSEIPHPFIEESMHLFSHFSSAERQKIHFIHLNHTNPVLDINSKDYRHVIQKGFSICRELEILEM